MSKFNKIEAQYQRPAIEDVAAPLVALCADQIEAAVAEASADIDRLAQAVLNSAKLSNDLLVTFEEPSEEADSTEAQLQADSVALQQALSNASSRLQFVDRLQQRLSNVANNLTALATLMQSAELPITDVRWREFLETTRARFTMAQERQMFDAAFEVSAPNAAAAQDTASPQKPVLFDREITDEIE